jgi:P-type Ca2+ transporter type 2C
MDRAMVSSIFVSAVGLFTAVSVVYLLAWFSGAGQTKAQTMAFVSWLLGHVLLALNMRSDREPLLRLGILSNRLMILWGAAALVFVLVATMVPSVEKLLKTTALNAQEWALVIAVTLAGTFWIEIRKWLLWTSRQG